MHLLKKHPRFDCDLKEAALWYGGRNPAVAARLIDDAQLAIRAVIANPLRFSIWRGPIRRIKLRRFPHLVFYEFHNNTVFLLALAHGARNLPAVLSTRHSRG
jgi:plasmid stabilization system protein ParE